VRQNFGKRPFRKPVRRPKEQPVLRRCRGRNASG
jgi:hypothetical protein